MDKISVGFCGPPASGKSTLSRAVAAALGWPRVGFGEYVRAEARRRGLAETRESLQRLGEFLVAEDVDAFCGAVLAPVGLVSGRSVIIDGIRHKVVVRAMQDLLAPAELRLVYVGLDNASRISRLIARENIVELSLEQIDAHSTEVEVSQYVMQQADLIVDGTDSIPVLTKKIVSWIRNQPKGKSL